MSKNTGTVIQIMGPVLDIRFPEGMLPELLSATARLTMEKGDLAWLARR